MMGGWKVDPCYTQTHFVLGKGEAFYLGVQKAVHSNRYNMRTID